MAQLMLMLLTVLSPTAEAAGPLRVHPSNPRYFTDDSGRAIHLAGHQWFNDVQHTAWNQSMDVDWERYLDFMRERRMNYLRNWCIWSTGNPEDDVPPPVMPFARTGPGMALDGLPRFDLTRFDEAYFRRLAEQVALAEKRGVYISVMLFEVYGFLGGKENLWKGNLFHGPNNVQGIDVDTDANRQGMEFFYTDDAQIRDIQRRYVEKVVQTLNPFDNVFFEIANELRAPDWQLEMLRAVRETEAGLPKRHLVYLSPGGRTVAGKWSQLPKKFFLDSTADVVSVAANWDQSYRGDPPVTEGRLPMIMDMDHVAAANEGENDWNRNPLAPWKSFTRGYHVCIYDGDYWRPTERRQIWDDTRRSCGATVELAGRVDLAAMQPLPELASTRYCLSHPGVEYIVLQPTAGSITVEKLQRGAKYHVQWLRLTDAAVISQETWTADGTAGMFDPPESPAVLHLRAVRP